MIGCKYHHACRMAHPRRCERGRKHMPFILRWGLVIKTESNITPHIWLQTADCWCYFGPWLPRPSHSIQGGFLWYSSWRRYIMAILIKEKQTDTLLVHFTFEFKKVHRKTVMKLQGQEKQDWSNARIYSNKQSAWGYLVDITALGHFAVFSQTSELAEAFLEMCSFDSSCQHKRFHILILTWKYKIKSSTISWWMGLTL